VDVAVLADGVLVLELEHAVRRIGADRHHVLVVGNARRHVAPHQPAHVDLGVKLLTVLAEQLPLGLVLEALDPRRDRVDHDFDALRLDVGEGGAQQVHHLVRRHAEPAADLLDQELVHLDQLGLLDVEADRLDVGIVVEVRGLAGAERTLVEIFELGTLALESVRPSAASC
jgi:hypothetical protein